LLLENDIAFADENTRRIGGPGVIVEVDESKFGKRKHNRGHRVEGCWVLAGVERGGRRKMFACTVRSRSARTLRRVLRRHILPGTIVITDLWKGYNTQDMIQSGFIHYTVNHSQTFVDPQSGAHTNTIEGTWSGIKYVVNKRNRTHDKVGAYLFVFIWRRQYAGMYWDRVVQLLRL
jgi:transposase-like protein